jgi:hypothetical protein
MVLIIFKIHLPVYHLTYREKCVNVKAAGALLCPNIFMRQIITQNIFILLEYKELFKHSLSIHILLMFGQIDI